MFNENEHMLPGHSVFTHWIFDSKKMLDCYRGNDCMEKICKDLKVHATKIINYEKNKWYH